MTAARASGQWVIAASLLLALLLSVWPLPLWAQWGRPEWVAMVLIYWVLALPARVGIGVCWFTGLVLDILEGSPPGQNALALGVVAYELFCGKRPFRGNNLIELSREICYKELSYDHSVFEERSIDLQHLLAKILDKDPALRFNSAKEIESLLEAHLSCQALKQIT